MAYPINLIQRTSDGYVLGACGCSFTPLATQANYANALFIGGDPNALPDYIGPGLPAGEYRVMTFFTAGRQGSDFPMYQGIPFSNYNSGPTGGNITIDFGKGSWANPSSNITATWYSDWAGNGKPLAFWLWTQDQQDTFGIYDAILWDDIDNKGLYPQFSGLWAVEMNFRGPDNGEIATGYVASGIEVQWMMYIV